MAGRLRLAYDREYEGIRAAVREIRLDGAAPRFDIDVTVRGRPAFHTTLPDEAAARALVDTIIDSAQDARARGARSGGDNGVGDPGVLSGLP